METRYEVIALGYRKLGVIMGALAPAGVSDLTSRFWSSLGFFDSERVGNSAVQAVV